MSRKGNCWDNAVAESFFSSLKKERIKKQIYKNRELAIADVANYIDTFYNRTRRHSHLGGLVPNNSKLPTRRAGGVATKSWELQKWQRENRHMRIATSGGCGRARCPGTQLLLTPRR